MKRLILITACLIAVLSVNNLSAQVPDTTRRDTTRQDTTQTDTSETTTADTTQSTNDLSGMVAASPEYSTLAKIIEVTGAGASLKGAGPYTVFAPTNQGFATLTQPKLDSLAKDTAKLNSVVQYHVVKGKYTKDDILKKLTAGNNKMTLTTLSGETLSLTVNDQKNLELNDAKGNKAQVMVFDKMAKNGIIHDINNVLLPAK